jgi:hypothetical protein
MLTPKDITKLSDYLLEVFKDVFITKPEFQQLYQKITNLQNSVDDFAKNSKDNDQETAVYGHRVKRLETWTE